MGYFSVLWYIFYMVKFPFSSFIFSWYSSNLLSDIFPILYLPVHLIIVWIFLRVFFSRKHHFSYLFHQDLTLSFYLSGFLFIYQYTLHIKTHIITSRKLTILLFWCINNILFLVTMLVFFSIFQLSQLIYRISFFLLHNLYFYPYFQLLTLFTIFYYVLFWFQHLIHDNL